METSGRTWPADWERRRSGAGCPMCGDVRPCHINYQLLGNAVPHVHAHVIPRYLDDPDPERPLGPEVWAAAAPLDAADLARQVQELRRAASEGEHRTARRSTRSSVTAVRAFAEVSSAGHYRRSR